jgi:hypothetical protein
MSITNSAKEKIYQALDEADRALSQAQSQMDDAMPKLLGQFEKKKER